MRVLLAAIGLGLTAAGAMAQPADCPAVPAAPGGSLPVTIDLSGRSGVPSGVNGKAWVNVPMQAPRTDCGEPAAPADVLRGEPGDLLRGTSSPPDER